MNSKEEQLKSILAQRQQAYRQVFNLENQFLDLVLDDLAKFCRADSTTFHPDPRVHAALEGRREVYLRIKDHLKLTQEQLLKKYK